MKKLIPFAIVVVTCAVAGLAFVALWANYYSVITSQTYGTLDQAIREGVATNGWLPTGLPSSATNIRVLLNHSANTAIAAFSFDPSQDLTSMLRDAKEVSLNDGGTIVPPPDAKGVSWFPEAIAQGKFKELTATGFRLYSLVQTGQVGSNHVVFTWYVAVDPDGGACYLWFRVLLG